MSPAVPVGSEVGEDKEGTGARDNAASRAVLMSLSVALNPTQASLVSVLLPYFTHFYNVLVFRRNRPRTLKRGLHVEPGV